jgi:hypothetical protein
MRGCAVAAPERMDTEGKKSSRVLRLAPADFEPHLLGFVPVAGACQMSRALNKLGDARGHDDQLSASANALNAPSEKRTAGFTPAVRAEDRIRSRY